MTNLIIFYDKITCLVNEGKAVLSAWTLINPWTLVSHRVLQEPIVHGLDGCTGLDDWAQRVLVRKNQDTNLIDTLNQPLLDMGKTTFWFQILVSAAWGVLPQSIHNYLAVLPSRFSCKLQLKKSSHRALLNEMRSGVENQDLMSWASSNLRPLLPAAVAPVTNANL